MKNLYMLAGIAVVAIILIVGGTWLMGQGSQSQTATSTTEVATTTTTKGTPAKTTTGTTKVTTTTVTTKPDGTTTTGAAPKITALSPTAAIVGSTITITGSGFSPTKNYVLFGTSADRSHPDGSPDNSIVTAGSPDGKTLSFTVPSAGPSGMLCDSNGHCIGVSAIRITPGQYPVSVRNQYGTSDVVVFTVTGS